MLARSILDMQTATTAEEMETANNRLTPGARRMWCLLLRPEYDGYGPYDDFDAGPGERRLSL